MDQDGNRLPSPDSGVDMLTGSADEEMLVSDTELDDDVFLPNNEEQLEVRASPQQPEMAEDVPIPQTSKNVEMHFDVDKTGEPNPEMQVQNTLKRSAAVANSSNLVLEDEHWWRTRMAIFFAEMNKNQEQPMDDNDSEWLIKGSMVVVRNLAEFAEEEDGSKAKRFKHE